MTGPETSESWKTLWNRSSDCQEENPGSREFRLPESRRRKRRSPVSPRSLEEAEIAHIRQILDEQDWNISHAAKVLEVDRTTLHKKIHRYGLERSSL